MPKKTIQTYIKIRFCFIKSNWVEYHKGYNNIRINEQVVYKAKKN